MPGVMAFYILFLSFVVMPSMYSLSLKLQFQYDFRICDAYRSVA